MFTMIGKKNSVSLHLNSSKASPRRPISEQTFQSIAPSQSSTSTKLNLKFLMKNADLVIKEDNNSPKNRIPIITNTSTFKTNSPRQDARKAIKTGMQYYMVNGRKVNSWRFALGNF